jgi:hypothetical protein
VTGESHSLGETYRAHFGADFGDNKELMELFRDCVSAEPTQITFVMEGARRADMRIPQQVNKTKKPSGLTSYIPK